MTAYRLWQLGPAVRIARDSTGTLHLVGPTTVALGRETPELLSVLRTLRTGCRRLPSEIDGQQLLREGLLDEIWYVDEQQLWTRQPLAEAMQTPSQHDEPLVLAPHAVLHRDGEHWRLEAPGAASTLLLGDAGRTTVDVFTSPTEAGNAAVEPAAVEMLRRDRLVVSANDPEDGWETHDAWFHARSRWGGTASRSPVGPVDASMREPAVAAVAGDEVIQLPPATMPLDVPLADALAARRSVRSGDPSASISLDQLSSLLWLSAGVQSRFEFRGESYTKRPYPSGGTCHPLELYVSAGRVAGIHRGTYHYDPADHRLTRCARDAGALLRAASRASMQEDEPACLISITARFGRTLPRYAGMGYATILKDAGALLQTLYLVSTALDLSATALGNGDTRLIAEAIGASPRRESGVGEFIVNPSEARSIDAADANVGQRQDNAID